MNDRGKRVAKAAGRGAVAAGRGAARLAGKAGKAGYDAASIERCPHCGEPTKTRDPVCPHCGQAKDG